MLAREKALLHRENLLDRPELTIEDVRESARIAAHEVLTRIGVDAEDPIEMQKDFQHIRTWRLATEKARDRTMLAVLGIIVTGTLAALWVGIKDIIHR